MKYILLPIHPEWCCKFMNGDKKTEVRSGTRLYNAINRLIEEQGKAPCLMYCTKGEDILIAYENYDESSMNYYGKEYAIIAKNRFTEKPSKDDEDYSLYESERDAYDYYKNDFDRIHHDHEWKLNGKVIAEFEASAEIISLEEKSYDDFSLKPWLSYETATLDQDELVKLSCLDLEGFDEYLGEKDGTAIHVKPGTMRTEGFPKNLSDYGIKKAPQSFMYVEVAE